MPPKCTRPLQGASSCVEPWESTRPQPDRPTAARMVFVRLLTFIASLLVSSCGTASFTDVRFHAEEELAASAAELELRVLSERGGVLLHDRRAVKLPAGVRVRRGEGDWFGIEATLIGENGDRLSTLRVGTSHGPGDRLDLWFRDDCQGVFCPAGETCRGGSCTTTCVQASLAGDAVSTSCAPTVLAVDPSVDPSFPCGSVETPCQRIEDAMDQVLPGGYTEIWLRGDSVHLGPVRFTEGHAGTAVSPLRIRSWPGTGTATVDANGADSALTIYGGESRRGHIVVEGLRITGGVYQGVLVESASGSLIRGSEITRNGTGPSVEGEGGGIRLREADDTFIVGNLVWGNQRQPGTGIRTRGITINGSSDVVVRGNQVYGNDFNGLRIIGGRGVALIENAIVGNGGNGVSLWGEQHELRDNLICESGRDGVRVVEAFETLILRNTLVQNGGSGASFDGGARSSILRDNLVAFNGLYGFESSAPRGVPGSEGNVLFGNERGPSSGFEPSASDTTGRDPLLSGLDSCEVRIDESSFARSAASDGGRVGSRAFD